MPSGSKRRKAAKNKSKKDSNNHHNHLHTNSSSHGIADHEPVDSRESQREEVDKAGWEEAMTVVDQQEPNALVEEIASEVEVDASDSASRTSDFGSVDDVAKEETPAVLVTSEEGVHVIDGTEDEGIVVVEEEKAVISSAADEEVPKAVDYVPEEGVVIGADPAAAEELHKSVVENIRDDELITEVVALAQQVIPVAESSVMISDVVNSELKKDAEIVSTVSDDKEKVSLSTLVDGQSDKTASQVVSLDEDTLLGAAIVKNTIVVVETSSKQIEEQVVASEKTVTQVVGSVRNGETRLQLHDHVGAAAVSKTSRGVDNGTEPETQPLLEENLVASNPLLVRRTSWMGCCGLFEVVSGDNR